MRKLLAVAAIAAIAVLGATGTASAHTRHHHHHGCHTAAPAFRVGEEDFTWNLVTGAATVTGTFLSGTGTITHEAGPVFGAQFGSCRFDVIPVATGPGVNPKPLVNGAVGDFELGTPTGSCRFWGSSSSYQVHGAWLFAQVTVVEAA